MKKYMANNKIFYKLYICCIVFIIMFSYLDGILGQVLGFKAMTTHDREGGIQQISVPEAGDAVKVPSEVQQSAGTYEPYDRNWSYSNKTLNDMWVEQGKPASDSHWAYIEVGGEKRYVVAVVPTFGVVGDYIDIYIENNGDSKIYPCIIGDSKDIWVDSAYFYNQVAYGHKSGDKCNIIEVCSELSSDTSNRSKIALLLNKLTGVTQIVNGGSIFEHPDGPEGLDGPYNYEDGSLFGGLSSGQEDESESYYGNLFMMMRETLASAFVAFDNSYNDKNNVTSLFDFKHNDKKSNSTGITDEKIQAMYDEYLKNKGKPYKMDHSNLSYDECMQWYDCSSWVIHCLAHSGVKQLPASNAEGIFNNYCERVEANDRQPGDLIFLQGTYKSGISHVGIYLGQMTVDGVSGEYIIDTGGNPTGVTISAYAGQWTGQHFYAFGRLKD